MALVAQNDVFGAVAGDFADGQGVVPAGSGRALFGMNPAALRELLESLGERPFRAVQLGQALYKQRVASLDGVTTLSAELREKLRAAGYAVGLPQLAQTAKSVDGTERYLVRLADGETVETVWMPNGDLPDDDEDAAGETYQRATICVSSQVGCAVNCQFCLTAKLGIRRNLTAGEIAGQVAAVLNRHGVQLGSGRGRSMPDRINLVFMGMGEPFLNYDAFMAAVGLLVEEMGIPASRMTVSTSGDRAGDPEICAGAGAAESGAEFECIQRCGARRDHADYAQVEYRGAAGRAGDDSAGQARVCDVRVCAAGRGKRPAGACAGGAGAACGDSGEGESDCVESGAGGGVPTA